MIQQPYIQLRLGEQRQRDLRRAAAKSSNAARHSGPGAEAERGLVGAKLRVQLIGPFCVSFGPKVAGPWPRPPAKRICELVFVSPGQRIAREVVYEELFSDLSPKEASKALSRALSQARATLSPLGSPASRLLQADRTFVWAHLDLVEDVDLGVLETALRCALAVPGGAERDGLLVEALAWRGDVLEDEPFASWAIAAREHLDCLRGQARLALARDRASGKGHSQPGSVIDAWEDCLSHDPICEEAGAALIRAYSTEGKKALAEATYKRCCTALQEFGLQRSDLLEEAHDSITPPAHHPGGREARPASWVGEERRLASVVFVELVRVRSPGAVGVDALADLVSTALAEVVGQIEAFGGTITAVTGIGLVALFGAPKSHEDDPERALRAAFGAIAAGGYAAKGVSVRAGVETGTICTRPIGRTGQYGAIGEAVEVAAALQAAAKPSSVLVGPVTRAATDGLFDWGPTQAVPVPTSAEPLRPAYLERPRARPVRRRQGRGSLGTSRVVGRQPELSSVQDALDEAASGHGRVVVITGEAGMGKTRLVEECRKLFIAWTRGAAGRLPLWLSANAVSHLCATPYGLYQRMLSAWVGAAPEEGEEIVSTALERALGAVAGRAGRELLTPLLQVMGLGTREKAVWSGRGRARGTELSTPTAVRSMVSRLITYGPAVLVLEDLHWADAGSIEVTQELLSLVLEGPLLIVLTWRQERSHRLGPIESALAATPGTVQRIELRPLVPAAQRDLCRALLGDLSDDVLDGIVEAAGGNPLFLEEHLASLLEAKALVNGDNGWRLIPALCTEVPDGIRRLVQSRLDVLAPNQRNAIVAASVLKPDFSIGRLRAVADLDIDFTPVVSDLCREGLLAHARRRPEPTYRFRCPLFQDAIYQGLLDHQMSRLNARAASPIQSRAS